MRIPSHHHLRSREDLPMTPMIDVVFLLLIFFVCASIGQVSESLLPTELSAGALDSPQAQDELKPFGEVWLFLLWTQKGHTAVRLNQGGDLYRDFAVLKQQLETLAEATTEIPVILDIASQVPLGDMIRVWDICRDARFESINFAIDPETVREDRAE